MGWWPFSDPTPPEPDPEPAAPVADFLPDPGDPGAVYCGVCGLGRWRIGDVMLCAVCDNPAPAPSGAVPPRKETP